MAPLPGPGAPGSPPSHGSPGATGRFGAVSPADLIVEVLSAYLGPSTARTAVRTFSARALGARPEDISIRDAPRLLEALRPVLRTLLGCATADVVLGDIRGRFG